MLWRGGWGQQFAGAPPGRGARQVLMMMMMKQEDLRQMEIKIGRSEIRGWMVKSQRNGEEDKEEERTGKHETSLEAAGSPQRWVM